MNKSFPSQLTDQPLAPNVESVLLAFEAAWQGGIPQLDDFLRAPPEAHRLLLEELIKIDLERRWRRAAQAPTVEQLADADSLPLRPLLEDYSARYPELGSPAQLPPELIGEEFWVRHCWGDRPNPEEYARRFARPAAELLLLLSHLGERLRAAPPLSVTGLAITHSAGASVNPPALQAVRGYEILGELGRGGMGVVYKARQVGLNRLVALKMIRSAALASAGERQRFRTEAEAVARLQHPHIVQVYEVGEADGLLYLALEFLDSGTLEERLGGRPLAAREAATLLQTLARAVQFAHERGVVHRDLKPANILLGSSDGVLKVADFGLAKQLDAAESQTQTGAIMGTPHYMSPEQAQGKGEGRHIGPATDIYALGAMLYEMLTGRTPFCGETPMDTLNLVVTQEPVPPARLVPQLPRDLETICLKCLQKEPQRRYATAAALADDLGRFLADEPIHARPVGRGERVWRWCRRNPAVSALTAAVALALVTGAVVALAFAVEARRREDDAVAAAALARQETTRADAAAVEANQNAWRAGRRAYVSDMQRIGHEWRAGRVDRIRTLLDGQLPERTGGPDLRGMEWHFWDHLCSREVFVFRGHTTSVANVAFSPDGRRLVSVPVDPGLGAKGDTLKIWEAATGKVLHSLPGCVQMALSPDGRWVAAERTDGPPRGVHVTVWEAETGKESCTFQTTLTINSPEAICFSPDSRLLAVRDQARTAGIWDRATGKRLHTLDGHLHRVRSLAFRPDGVELATASDDRTVRLWDVATGACRRVISAHPREVWTVAFSPDGKWLATGGEEGTVKFWDAVTGAEAGQFAGHTDSVCCVAFSPDGKLLASAGADLTVRVWARGNGGLLWCFRGHTEPVKGLAFSPDGRRLATASEDRTVRVWDVVAGPAAVGLSAANPDGPWLVMNSLAVPPGDERRLICATFDGMVRTHDLDSGCEIRSVMVPATGQSLGELATSPDGRFFAGFRWRDRAAKVYECDTGKLLATGPAHNNSLDALAVSPDGRQLATLSQRQNTKNPPNHPAVKVWGSADGREHFSLGIGEAMSAVTFSPDGRLLATGGGNLLGFVGIFRLLQATRIQLWSAQDGRAIRSFDAHTAPIKSLAFSPDGTLLASAGDDRVVKVWEVASGKELLSLVGHFGPVWRVQFSPDGARLASGGFSSQVGNHHLAGETLIWNLSDGNLLLAFDELFQGFTPDGRRLLTMHPNAINLWELTPRSQTQAREQEAVRLFRYHLASSWLKEEVVSGLLQDSSAPESVRRRALELAGRYRETPARLGAESWRVSQQAKADDEARRLALRQAEAACRLEPANGDYLTACGAALYRVGRPAEALDALKRANLLSPDRPAVLAFTALAQHRLGHGEARRSLESLDAVMRDPKWYRERPLRDLHAQTRAAVLGVPTHVRDLDSWRVVGPFAGGAAKDVGLSTRFPPEGGVDLSANYPGRGGAVRWRQARAGVGHYIDLVPVIEDNVKAVAYAYCEIDSPGEQDAVGYLGTDDSSQLWVNGKLVHTNPRRRPSISNPARLQIVVDEDRVIVPLRRGRNQLLLKVVNYEAAFGFQFQLESPRELKEVP